MLVLVVVFLLLVSYLGEIFGVVVFIGWVMVVGVFVFGMVM